MSFVNMYCGLTVSHNPRLVLGWQAQATRFVGRTEIRQERLL